MPLVARVRRLFDLDARPDVIAATLGRDRALAPLVARAPRAARARRDRSVRGRGARAARAAGLGRRRDDARRPLRARVRAAPSPTRRRCDVRFPTAGRGRRATSRAIAKIGLPGARARRDPRLRARGRDTARSRLDAARPRARSSPTLDRAARHRAVDRALPRDARAAPARRVSRRRSRRAEGARARLRRATPRRAPKRGDRFARTPSCTCGPSSGENPC